MRRRNVWLQVAVAWLPVWAIYAAMIIFEHRPASPLHSAILALISMVPASILGVFVYGSTKWLPWPRRLGLSFVLAHVLGSIVYAVAWIVGLSLIQSALNGHLVVLGPGFGSFMTVGIFLYMVVAGVSYAIDATERLARAENEASRAQLEALRAQLHPHFVFNALHTVVQLIPVDPKRAAQAAEDVAHLLRTTVEEDRDIVSLSDEWSFVQRYIELERLRFGDRLRVVADIPGAAADALLPSFSLQTLVENAIRHGAAPREETTTVTIQAAREGGRLFLTVEDDGVGATPERLHDGTGSGLPRLRARLEALYGGAATLSITGGRRGVSTRLDVPQGGDDS